MEKYIGQLLEDLEQSTVNATFPFGSRELDIHDWLSPEEENRTARVRELEEWTGIGKEQLPPPEMLTDEQVRRLLDALKKLLDAYNCCFVLQTVVPNRIQYATIRDNFHQQVKVRQWHMGFFELCADGTEHHKCSLVEYCQCRFNTDLFSGFEDKRTPEEDRRAELEIEIQHLKRKYEEDWMKYYPYHLDADYDDEFGNPYDYGFDSSHDDDDDWWRK